MSPGASRQEVICMQLHPIVVFPLNMDLITLSLHPARKLQVALIRFTKSLMIAARVTGISFFEHIIIGDNRYFSFADEGFIREYKAVPVRKM